MLQPLPWWRYLKEVVSSVLTGIYSFVEKGGARFMLVLSCCAAFFHPDARGNRHGNGVRSVRCGHLLG